MLTMKPLRTISDILQFCALAGIIVILAIPELIFNFFWDLADHLLS